MSDTTTTEPTVADTGNPTGLSAAVPAPASKKHNYVAEGFQNRTRGEAAFNAISYAGVGYFAVTAVSIFLTWVLRDSKASSWYNGQLERVTQFANRFRKVEEGTEAYQKLAKGVDSNMTIATLFAGGTIMSVLPIKWMEDNKAKIVRSFDRMLYGKEKVENDPTIRAAHEDLAAAPKQTWTSVFASRVLAFAATFGTSLLMGANTSFLGKRGHSIDKYSIHAGRWLDGAINHNDRGALKAIEKVREKSPHDLVRFDPKHPNKPVDRTSSKVFSYITLDAFYTLITSSALYVFTRVFAPMFDKEIKHRTQQEKLQSGIATETSTAPHAANDDHARPANDHPAPRINSAELSGRVIAPSAHAATLG